MPLCTRAGLNKKAKPAEEYDDDEEVFFCETTKEVFRDYEDYFQRVMLLNSTIWSCAETGKQNLTYAEALKSERKIRKYLREPLKAPALMATNVMRQSSITSLVHKVYAFLKDRIFLGEEVLVSKIGQKAFTVCRVLEIITPKQVPADGIYDPKTIKYKVQSVKKATHIWETTSDLLHRKRSYLTLDSLKAFLNDHTLSDEQFIHVKPEFYQKYVTSKNVTFDKIFAGKMPQWEPSKHALKGLKQTSIGNYVVKNGEDPEKVMVNLKEEMDRLRREREEKTAEQERKRAELLVQVEKELNRIMCRCDDLERNDQKVLPNYKPIKTLVPSKYFGEFLMIQEFLHSFAPILSASDVFRTNITFQQMCRAFLVREVAGPLSDILQVLLSTIFTLLIEEENECPVNYANNDKKGFMWTSANSAVDAHRYVNKYFALDMTEMPIDAQTLSEILRLHLLGSGAPNAERTERWRYQYRNGYSVIEDPGLLLRIQQPHILRALKMYTIYQLPFKDILKVINCLIEQILTYNPTLLCLEERQDTLIKVRSNIRLMVGRENKRQQQVITMKKTANAEYQAGIAEHMDNPDKKAELERILQRKLKDVDDQDEREKRNFQYELGRMNAEMFDYLVLLGTDRAYRRYYVFESLPGMFIEHPSECDDTCLKNLLKNDSELASLINQRGKIRQLLYNRYKNGDKENKVVIKPEIVENGQIVKVNGTSSAVNVEKNATESTPSELYMCSGDPKTCIVHDPNNSERKRWSYLNTPEELEILINSLNPLGIRESALREQLIKLKDNILPHLVKCPENILNVDISKNREECMAQMINETRRKYANSNFGFSENAEINEVMLTTLTNQILEFESTITTGSLGTMKIPDIEKWRADITANTYNSQCAKLTYGPEVVDVVFEDPGHQLGDTLDIESEDSSDEGISVHDSPTLRRNVNNLASALLQIEQSIEQKFLKEPFGAKTELKNRGEMDAKLAAGKKNLEYWEVSLMQSTSYSQVFLHFNILSDAVKWNKSTTQSSCLICKRRGDADKLLLCDECNAGTHMFCMKPVMKKVPEGNWYCFKCELKHGMKNNTPRQKRKKRIVFTMDDDIDDADENRKLTPKPLTVVKYDDHVSDSDDDFALSTGDEEFQEQVNIKKGVPKKRVTKKQEKQQAAQSDDSDESKTNIEDENMYVDGDTCKHCNSNCTDLSCGSCKECYHLDCVGLRRTPRGVWQCSACKTSGDRKRRKAKIELESDLSEESDESEKKSPPAKRARRSKKTTKDDASLSSDELSKNNNNSRRVRRTNESLKLNTIVLYDLLEQIMKHDDAWPFLRPVTQNEVPDYHEIIKNPMDFARIKSNLNMCRYSTNEDVVNDIQLVFSNCDTYNSEGNDIYKAGATLEKFVLAKCKELNIKFNPSDMIADQEEE